MSENESHLLVPIKFTLSEFPGAGYLIHRGIFSRIPSLESLNFDISGLDHRIQVSMECAFDCNPLNGDLSLYKRSTLFRGTGTDPVNYSPEIFQTTPQVLFAKNIGVLPGFSFRFSNGLESFGLYNGFDVDITDLSYAIRVVPTAIGFTKKGQRT